MGGVIIKNSYNDLFEYINTINNENKLQTPKKTNKTLALCVNILSISLLISGGFGIKYLIEQKNISNSTNNQNNLILSQQNAASEIKETIENSKQEDKNINKDFSKLKEQNPDTVAWLYVKDTEINTPIVQGKDNSYYLTHNFNKEYSAEGWAFADSNNKFPELSTNTVIYGNTYKKTNTLTTLKNILESNWLNNKKNHLITLDTEQERLTFQIFSIYTLEKTNDYIYTEFTNNEEYQKYLNKSLERSIKNFNINPTTEDKILTLSNYIEDSEIIVIQAKLIGTE